MYPRASSLTAFFAVTIRVAFVLRRLALVPLPKGCAFSAVLQRLESLRLDIHR